MLAPSHLLVDAALIADSHLSGIGLAVVILLSVVEGKPIASGRPIQLRAGAVAAGAPREAPRRRVPFRGTESELVVGAVLEVSAVLQVGIRVECVERIDEKLDGGCQLDAVARVD